MLCVDRNGIISENQASFTKALHHPGSGANLDVGSRIYRQGLILLRFGLWMLKHRNDLFTKLLYNLCATTLLTHDETPILTGLLLGTATQIDWHLGCLEKKFFCHSAAWNGS